MQRVFLTWKMVASRGNQQGKWLQWSNAVTRSNWAIYPFSSAVLVHFCCWMIGSFQLADFNSELAVMVCWIFILKATTLGHQHFFLSSLVKTDQMPSDEWASNSWERKVIYHVAPLLSCPSSLFYPPLPSLPPSLLSRLHTRCSPPTAPPPPPSATLPLVFPFE